MSIDKLPFIQELENMVKDYERLLCFPGCLLLSRSKRKNMKKEISEMKEILAINKKAIKEYNGLFAGYGWIVHESMSEEIIIDAVKTYHEDGLEKAEEKIIAYYKEKYPKVKKYIFYNKYFKSRERLFNLAYEDFESGRYYSSIPLVLMLVDGVLNDVKAKGFSASNEDYSVWDSFSGHDSGLNQIHKIYTKTIKKTIEDEVDQPYRNGILHGRILNYDNEKLAVKCLALIIYIYDWIKSYDSETARIGEYVKEKHSTFSIREFIQSRKKIKADEELNQQWSKTAIKEVMYNTEELATIENGTPEAALVDFINNLNNEKYGKNVSYIPFCAREGHKESFMAGEIKKEFSDFQPIKIKRLEVNHRGSATSTIKADLEYVSSDDRIKNMERTISFNMVYQDENGQVENRLKENGQWVIMQMFGKRFEMS